MKIRFIILFAIIYLASLNKVFSVLGPEEYPAPIFLPNVNDIYRMYEIDLKNYYTGDLDLDSLFKDLTPMNFNYKNEDSVFHLFSEILKIKKTELIYFYIGLMILEEKDTTKALEYLRLSNSVNSQFIPSKMLKAIIYYDLRKIDLATEELKIIFDIDKKDVNAQKFLVHIFEQQGKFDKAISLMDRIIELSTEDPYLFIKRGILYKKIGDLKKAEYNFNLAMVNKENPIGSLAYRSEFFDYYSEDSLAIIDIKKIIELDSTWFDIYYSLYKITLKYKRYNESLEALGKLIEKDPRTPYNYDKRADIYDKLDSTEKAERDRKIASAIRSNNK